MDVHEHVLAVTVVAKSTAIASDCSDAPSAARLGSRLSLDGDISTGSSGVGKFARGGGLLSQLLRTEQQGASKNPGTSFAADTPTSCASSLRSTPSISLDILGALFGGAEAVHGASAPINVRGGQLANMASEQAPTPQASVGRHASLDMGTTFFRQSCFAMGGDLELS